MTVGRTDPHDDGITDDQVESVDEDGETSSNAMTWSILASPLQRMRRHTHAEDDVPGILRGKYLGCYINNLNNPLLKGHGEFPIDNTPCRCMEICKKRGYVHAGVQFGISCSCGDEELPSDKIATDDECNEFRCLFDTNLFCGGASHMKTYEIRNQGTTCDLTDCLCSSGDGVPIVGRCDGSPQCGDQREVDNNIGGQEELETQDPIKTLPDSTTTTIMEGGQEELETQDPIKTLPDSTTTTIMEGILRGKYLGCYISDGNYLLLKGHEEFSLENTPCKCMEICKKRGYVYAGVQFGTWCSCGDEELTSDKIATDDECHEFRCFGDSNLFCGGVSRMKIYEIRNQGTTCDPTDCLCSSGDGVPIVGRCNGSPQCGDQRDVDNNIGGQEELETQDPIKTLPDSTTTLPDSTTTLPDSTTTLLDSTTTLPESTTTLPDSTTTLPDSTTTLPDSTTTLPDSTTTLPDSTTTLPDSSNTPPDSTTTTIMEGILRGKYLGCYISNGNIPLLKGHGEFFLDNAPCRCMEICKKRGYVHAGVLGIWCFCGDEELPSDKIATDDECHEFRCLIDTNLFCGGVSRMKTYEIRNQGTTCVPTDCMCSSGDGVPIVGRCDGSLQCGDQRDVDNNIGGQEELETQNPIKTLPDSTTTLPDSTTTTIMEGGQEQLETQDPIKTLPDSTTTLLDSTTTTIMEELVGCPSTERTLLNTTWNLTKIGPGMTLKIPCPGHDGSTHNGHWRCGPEGEWDQTPDLSGCRNYEDLFLAPQSEGPELAVVNLTKLKKTIHDGVLLPGDLLSIIGELEALQKQHGSLDIHGQGMEVATILSERYVSVLLEVTNTLLAQQWFKFMPEKNIRASSTVLQKEIVKAALTQARFVTSDTAINFTEDDSSTHVRLVIKSRDYFTKEENRLYEHPRSRGTRLLLPENFFDNGKEEDNSEKTEENVVVVFNSFSNLHCLTNDVPCKPPSEDDSSESFNVTAQVNSMMIGATVGHGEPWRAEPNEFVELNFSHIYDGTIYRLENVECRWWNNVSDSWSSDDCKLIDTNQFYSICHCNHLTNLAVIMDIRGLLHIDSNLWKVLQWITTIGCSLSIICLAISIFCFFILKIAREKNKSNLGAKKCLIRLHLCVCLLVAEFVLLVGLDKTSNKILCTIVAAVMHYFFLATFTWSAIEAFNLYLAVKKVFEMPISQKHYLLAGYGIPLVFVGITLAIARTDYISERVCWLAPHSVIWSFAGTIAFIMMVNIVVFVMVMHIVWKERSIGENVKNSHKPKKMKKIVGSVALFFVLGLTWITAFFFMTEASKSLAVIFTLVNSLQGICILFLGILLDEDMRRELKQILKLKWQNLRHQADQNIVVFDNAKGSTEDNDDVTGISFNYTTNEHSC